MMTNKGNKLWFLQVVCHDTDDAANAPFEPAIEAMGMLSSYSLAAHVDALQKAVGKKMVTDTPRKKSMRRPPSAVPEEQLTEELKQQRESRARARSCRKRKAEEAVEQLAESLGAHKVKEERAACRAARDAAALQANAARKKAARKRRYGLTSSDPTPAPSPEPAS
jgi:hypothetical protein